MNDTNLNPFQSQETPASPEPQALDSIDPRLVRDLLAFLRQPEPWPEVLLDTLKPQGPKADIASLVAALTALRQEAGMQGRRFQQLEQAVQASDPLQTVVPTLREMTAGFTELQSVMHTVSTEALAQARKEAADAARTETFHTLIEPLLDTHDQLTRLIEQSQTRQKAQSGFHLFSRKDTSKDLLETLALTLKKITQRLHTLDIIPIAAVGNPFDAREMKAVDKMESPSCTQMTVLEVYQQGYRHQNQTLRFAEVKVQCPPSSALDDAVEK